LLGSFPKPSPGSTVISIRPSQAFLRHNLNWDGNRGGSLFFRAGPASCAPTSKRWLPVLAIQTAKRLQLEKNRGSRLSHGCVSSGAGGVDTPVFFGEFSQYARIPVAHATVGYGLYSLTLPLTGRFWIALGLSILICLAGIAVWIVLGI
jgi:hypothetical protein